MCVLFMHGCGLDYCNFASSFQSPKYFQLQKLLVSNDSFQTSSEQEKILISIKKEVACWGILEIRLLLLSMLLHQVTIHRKELNYSQADFCIQTRSDTPLGMLMLGEQSKLTKSWNESIWNSVTSKDIFIPVLTKSDVLTYKVSIYLFRLYFWSCFQRGFYIDQYC